MRNNTKTILVGLVAVVSLGIFGVTSARTFWYAPNGEVIVNDSISVIPQKALAKENQPSSYPVRLKIPKIKVDAKIMQVGITKAGNMAAPSNFSDVGWYKYGAIPGEKGSAVIAGHVDRGAKFPAVFKRLGDLKKGDEIFVETAEGRDPIRFVVTGAKLYDYDAQAPEVFWEDNDTLLRLITCTGQFVKKYGTHDKRLVVTAVRVG